MKKLLLVSLCFLMLLVTQVFAQNRTVTGTVTGKDDGLPIPGVTVRVKGETTATQTNSAGKYTISASPNAILLFSFIGYETSSAPANGAVVNVSLSAGKNALNEVVVTALGVRKEKRALGYAEQTVTGDALVGAGQTDALNALNGKVAGAQITSSAGTPGAAVYIQLRGQTSITGNNQPLFVIDGVPVDNSSYITAVGGGTTAQSTNRAGDINPDDIESISVLKGPGASALYGNLATAGAIIITTKKGKAGKAQVDFSTSVSANSTNRLIKEQNQFIRGDGGAIANSNSSYRYSWGAKADTLFWTGVPNAYDQHGDIVGKSSPNAKIPFKAYDPIDNFFRTGYSYDNSVSISGGNDKATYRASVTNSYQNSIVPTEYYERTSIALAGQLQISKKVKISTSLTYTSSDGNQPQTGSNLSGIMLGLTRTPISFDNSNGLKDPAHNPLSYTLPGGQTNLSGGVQRDYRNSISYDNPYWTVNNNPYTAVVGRLFGNIQLEYAIGSGFNLMYRLGSDNYQDNRHQYYEIGSGGASGGEILDDRYTFRSINSDLILSYSKKLSEDFQFDGKVGNNIYGTKIDELETTGTGLVAAGFNNIANAGTITSSNGIVPYRTVSGYYDLSVNYKSLLYLETTGREDRASSLPPGKDSFFYPSVNLSFVFSELGSLRSSNVLSFGKLRASISQVGSAPGAFQTTTGFGASGITDGFTTGIQYPLSGLASYSLGSNLANPNLKPEKTTETEIGTELKFFQNRIGIDASVYYSNGTNLIFSHPIASSAGAASATVNAASMTNRGFEFVLTGTPVKGKDFTWNSFINFGLNRNKVTSLTNGQNVLFLAGFGGGETAAEAVVGKPLGVLYSYGYTRSAGKTVISDQPGLGVGPYYPLENTSVQVVTGDPNPKFKLGFGNTFTYQKLTLYGLIDWKYKGDVWNGTLGALTAYGRAVNTANRGSSTVFPGVLGHLNDAGQLVHYASDGVTEVAGAGSANTHSVVLNEAWYQGDGGGFGNNDAGFVEDGSYVKLRELTISYDFKDLFFGKNSTVIRGFSLGAFARNIIIWTPYKGGDPETSLVGSGGYGGLDYFNNPSAKTIGGSLKVKF